MVKNLCDPEIHSLAVLRRQTSHPGYHSVPVGRLFIVSDQADGDRVVSKLDDGLGAVGGHAGEGVRVEDVVVYAYPHSLGFACQEIQDPGQSFVSMLLRMET